MTISIADIESLFAEKGGRQYMGEPVTQLEHALQTAALATAAGASDTLIAASLLHDLGHLLNNQGAHFGDTPSARGVDDLHQYYALPFLRKLFPDEVTGPISLHVDAKRYLCATRDDYHALLSPDSKRSLTLQGGVFSPHQTAEFLTRRCCHDAVKLRLWDDAAKASGRPTPGLGDFTPLLHRVALKPA